MNAVYKGASKEYTNSKEKRERVFLDCKAAKTFSVHPQLRKNGKGTKKKERRMGTRVDETSYLKKIGFADSRQP